MEAHCYLVICVILMRIDLSKQAAPVITNLPASATINEDSSSASILTAAASDSDGDPITFTVFTSGPFTIDSNTGEVTYDGSGLDYEGQSSYSVSVTASDGTQSDTETLTVLIGDVDEYPYWASDPSAAFYPSVSVSADEHSPTGSVVWSADAVDPEGTTLTFNQVWYSAAEPSISFDSNGNLVVANGAAFDYETITGGNPSNAVFYFQITATDAGGLGTDAIFLDLFLDITINNINDAPTIASVAASYSISEGQALPHDVTDMDATDQDGDTVTFSLSASPSGPFVIDSNSGVISLSGALDYETHSSYTLTVTATDGTAASTSALTVVVVDVNETPQLTSLPTSLTLPEGTSGQAHLVTATDVDGDTVTFSVAMTTPATGSSALSIDSSSGALIITSPPGLDYETASNYVFTVTATDPGGLSATATIDITVTNVQEPPVISNLPTSDVSILEDVTSSSIIFTVVATDPEGDVIIYSLSAAPNDGKFNIHGSSGAISYVNNPSFNFEQVNRYDLTVLVRDEFGNTGTSGTLAVLIQNINETPVFSNLPTSPITIPEDTSTAANLFRVAFTDPDAGDSHTFTISVNPVSGQTKFSIASDGTLSLGTGAGLDYETVPSYIITVTVTDTGGLSVSESVTINIKDVNEPPVFQPSSISINVPEEQTIGSPVVTILAHDEDASDYVHYSLILETSGGLFHFDASSRNVTVASRIDYDATDAIRDAIIKIRAEDTAQHTTTMTISVTVVDINDNDPVFQLTSYKTSVLGTLPVGSTVITVNATDADSGNYGTVTYSIANTTSGSYFNISNDGIIATVTSLPTHVTSLTFQVTAADNGEPPKSASVYVNVGVIHPWTPVFTQNFYDFEIRDNATVGEMIGQVHAGNAVGYTTYYYTTGGSTDIIVIEGSTGVLSVGKTLTPGYHRHLVVIKAYSTSASHRFFSDSVVARIDTYVAEAMEVIVSLQLLCSQITQEVKNQVASSMNSLQTLDGASARVQYVCQKRSIEIIYAAQTIQRRKLLQASQSEISVVFVKDNSTSNGENLNQEKQFVIAAQVYAKLVADSSGTPVDDLRQSQLISQISLVNQNASTDTWWYSTTAGITVLCILVAMALVSIIIVTVAVVYFCCCRKKYTQSVPIQVKEQLYMDREVSVETFNLRYTNSSLLTPLPPKPISDTSYLTYLDVNKMAYLRSPSSQSLFHGLTPEGTRALTPVEGVEDENSRRQTLAPEQIRITDNTTPVSDALNQDWFHP